MSIIIRLRNLPLSAKSQDIRRFFGGLRIPNGGVHIVGGTGGDAFIAFTTDEDARLAMRKDNHKILNTRVKLYLSSRVEMQQEIGRITNEDSSGTSRQRSTSQRSSGSPFDERDADYDRGYRTESPSRGFRDRSPYFRHSRSRSPRRRSRSPRRRSRSPRKRSRSPMISVSRRSVSPMSSSGQRSNSPHRNNAGGLLFGTDKDSGLHKEGKLVDLEKLFGLAKGSTDWKTQDYGMHEEHALLEQKIAEALSASLSSIGKMTGMYPNPERIDDRALNIQGGRFVDPGTNMQVGRMDGPGINMQGGRIGDPGINIQGGRMCDPGINVQGGRMGDPGINMQGGRMGEPGINMQGGRMDQPGINMQVGRMGDPGINMQVGRMGDPGINMQVGRMGDPGINMQVGRMGEPAINIEGRSAREPGFNMPGERIGEFGIPFQAGRFGEQFANPNPNFMPCQPEYNSSGLREVPIQESNRLLLPNMLPPSNMPRHFSPGIQPLQHPQSLPPPMNLPPMINLPPPILMSSLPPPLPMPPPVPLTSLPPANNKAPPNMPNPNIPLQGFFVTMSGLNPLWNVNDLQIMLKGVFLPQKNVKWELDDKWTKTGTAFLKLRNKDEFLQLLSHATYSYQQRLITVSETPDFLFHKYFVPEVPTEGSLNSPSGNFYYKITGLPYEANYDSVLNFFEGLEVTDLYIIYSKCSQGFRIQGKATGIAFIAFGNSTDYQKAMLKNGQQFLKTRRFVKLASSSKKNFLDAKKWNNDLLSQSTVFVPADVPAPADKNSFQTHPLCILLSGLPQNITKGKIVSFFKKGNSNPGSIYILLNENQKPNGRAFVEFNNLQDFDSARNAHGKKISDKIICVKQILYSEMVKIMESHEKNNHENLLQNSLHSYSPSASEITRNQLDPGRHFSTEDNFNSAYNEREHSSVQNNIQVFEYGNKSREPDNTSGHSLNRQVPLKSCIKPSNPSYKRDMHQNQDSSPSSKPPFKSDIPKPDQFGNVGESRKSEPPKKDIQKSDQSPISVEPIKPKVKIGKSDKCLHSDESNKTELAKEALKIKSEISDLCPLSYRKLLEEAARTPVKFEVKIKPAISKSVKVEDAFDNSKLDPKKKLSKLSPERAPAVLVTPPVAAEVTNSIENIDNNKGSDKYSKIKNADNDKNSSTKNTDEDKNSKIKTTDEDKNSKTTDADKNSKTTDENKNSKTKNTAADQNVKNTKEIDKYVKSKDDAPKPKAKSPDKNARRSEKGSSLETRSSKSESRDSKNYKPRDRSRDRNYSRRYNEDRRRSPPRSSVHRPRSRSPPRRGNYPDFHPRDRVPVDQLAVVQICNVDPLIGSAELLHFLYDFEVDADKIIRRIGDRGELTGDVRVTFQNHRIAELAIRRLDGSYLNGVPVNMFIVD